MGASSFVLLVSLATAGPTPLGPLPTNRTLDRLPAEPRAAFAAAAKHFGARSMKLAEATLDAALLERLFECPGGAALTRCVRERTGRPVDVPDFVLFLDDLVANDRPGARSSLPASRARAYGVLLHPQDVFAKKPRVYGTHGEIPLDDPPSQLGLEPVPDGSVAGPGWTARYQQPMTDAGKLEELIEENPRFGKAMQSLFRQLEAAGAFTWVEAGVRPRERGFLIYGSWLVSRAPNPKALEARIAKLDGYEKAWGLDIDIVWRNPKGFKASVEGARAMADTYGVDYATPSGAQRSSHYGGKAVDLVAVELPASLTLKAPDGETRTFDLSGPDEPRDLSLTPALVDWIEAHFGVSKLRKDYPHWSGR